MVYIDTHRKERMTADGYTQRQNVTMNNNRERQRTSMVIGTTVNQQALTLM
jgi:hypothetical protein